MESCDPGESLRPSFSKVQTKSRGWVGVGVWEPRWGRGQPRSRYILTYFCIVGPNVSLLQVVNSRISMFLDVDSVYTLSTVYSEGIQKPSNIPLSAGFPLPYFENFNGNKFYFLFVIKKMWCCAQLL
jgi:hypothetical protein